MNLGRSQAIYFLIDDRSIVGVSTTMAELYAQYHDRQDGFLYMKYASQEVFG
jgi:microtubule-associated protein 1 light chain